jgi:hypothetical protein
MFKKVLVESFVTVHSFDYDCSSQKLKIFFEQQNLYIESKILSQGQILYLELEILS